MKPLVDWIELEKEERTKTTDLVIPDTAKSGVDAGDIFIAKNLGPTVDGISVGDRLLFYGMATVMELKLPSGKKTFVGRASDVAFKLEEGE